MKTQTRNIYCMYAIALLQGMVFYGPIATLYRQAKGVSVLQITIIESVSLALCLLLEFPWGILADKIGYKRTILLCNILYFLSKIVFLEGLWLSSVPSGTHYYQHCYCRPVRCGYCLALSFLQRTGRT